LHTRDFAAPEMNPRAPLQPFLRGVVLELFGPRQLATTALVQLNRHPTNITKMTMEISESMPFQPNYLSTNSGKVKFIPIRHNCSASLHSSAPLSEVMHPLLFSNGVVISEGMTGRFQIPSATLG
jgi:hypothetical protein